MEHQNRQATKRSAQWAGVVCALAQRNYDKIENLRWHFWRWFIYAIRWLWHCFNRHICRNWCNAPFDCRINAQSVIAFNPSSFGLCSQAEIMTAASGARLAVMKTTGTGAKHLWAFALGVSDLGWHGTERAKKKTRSGKSVCLCLSLSVLVRLCMSLSVSICLCLSPSLSLSLSVCFCLSLSVFGCLCLSLFAFVCRCLSLSVSVCLCCLGLSLLSLSVSVRLCPPLSVSVWLRLALSVSACLYLSLSVSVTLPHQPHHLRRPYQAPFRLPHQLAKQDLSLQPRRESFLLPCEYQECYLGGGPGDHENHVKGC